jgi:L-iditol 2-dehydrogenase
VPRPGADEVLIKVHACAICGSDITLLRTGSGLNLDYGHFIPGHEYSGEVVALGPGVTKFRLGDRVAVEAHKGCGKCLNCVRGRYTICLNYGRPETGHRHYGFTANGGYAEYVVNHTNTVYRIPDNVSYSEAALVTTGGCVMAALENAGGFIAGDSVAIFGPGPIGLMGVTICRALGASEIILVGTREDRLSTGRELGATLTLNVNEVPDVPAAIRAATDGLGVDLAIEASGSAGAAAACIDVVRRGGRISFIAYPKEKPALDIKRFVQDDLRATSVRGESGANCLRVLKLLSSGAIQVRPLITHHFALSQVNAAFDTFTARHGGAVKVILEPSSV